MLVTGMLSEDLEIVNLLVLVMCWLGLKARGQAKPSGIGQAKAKPRAWLRLAPGSGHGFGSIFGGAECQIFA